MDSFTTFTVTYNNELRSAFQICLVLCGLFLFVFMLCLVRTIRVKKGVLKKTRNKHLPSGHIAGRRTLYARTRGVEWDMNEAWSPKQLIQALRKGNPNAWRFTGLYFGMLSSAMFGFFALGFYIMYSEQSLGGLFFILFMLVFAIPFIRVLMSGTQGDNEDSD